MDGARRVPLVRELVLEVVGITLGLRENKHQAGGLEVVEGSEQHGELLVLVYELHLKGGELVGRLVEWLDAWQVNWFVGCPPRDVRKQQNNAQYIQP